MRNVIWVLLMIGLNVSLHAQSKSFFRAPRLTVENQEVNRGFLRIQYEVNYPGFVELHFFKEAWNEESGSFERKRLTVRGKVTEPLEDVNTTEKIKDYISMPVSSLEPGRYKFEIHYKGVVRTGSYNHEGP